MWADLLSVMVVLGGAMAIVSPLPWIATTADLSSDPGMLLWCRSLDWVASTFDWGWSSLRWFGFFFVKFVSGLGDRSWRHDGRVGWWILCLVVDLGFWLRPQGWWWWVVGGWQGRGWRMCGVLMVRSRNGKRKATTVCTSPAMRILGSPMVAA